MFDIFDDTLLRYGPWQEFERNMARLLLHAGWKDPRIIGRGGDGGADVLAVRPKAEIWLFQCKFSSKSAPGKEAIDEVRKAGKLYGADALCVVTSQHPTRFFEKELARLKALGLPISHIGPDQLKATAQRVPLYPPGRVELYEYQKDAVEQLRAAVLEAGRGQLVLATGLGKTVVVAELVADLLADDLLEEGRVLVLAHTVSLVDQLLVKFWRHLPKTVATHRLAQGERPISFEGITFATVQSFANLNDPPYFDLVIVDEAHHLGAPEYLRTVERLNPTKLVGVTATPWRSDGVSLNHILGSPVFSMGIKEGLADGFLSDVDYRIYLDNIDWNFVAQRSQYGYTLAQLNKRLLIPTRDEEAIHEIRRVYDLERRCQGLVFSPSQTHARSFASDLRRNGFTAAALTSDDHHTERYKRIANFSSGKLQFLCVVDIFNEGIDVPNVDLLVFLRVTHSRRIFVQQLGRGLRLSPAKRNVIVLDFAADIRRIHAALDLTSTPDKSAIEHLLLSHAYVSFTNKSLGNFFYEWIADLSNIQDCEEDEVVKLPIIDPHHFNFPDPLD
ncbi:DEAD/DEAH box helicase [Microcoleus sp. T3_D1]|uniref:DEAD/DEAH box helicase n=1 Tax=Microcoleus sp. T3_D1 TaxID=3055427 RepID=UPI002FCFAD75